jgi:16S rRNA (guanine966-N2)-methyltransferase
VKNKLRIIGGEWRSRQILFSETPGLRPTPARVRETLFNWLQYEIAGSRCLDLYAGSGALGFEAASRGAKRVVQVEQDKQACYQLKVNEDALSASQVKIVNSEVFRFLAGDLEEFDVAFLDPPFAKGLAVQTCQWLEDKGWLSKTAHIYLESEPNLSLQDIPENWRLLKEKQANEVYYRLFERT